MRMPVCAIVAGGLVALASPSFAQGVTVGAKIGVTVATLPVLEDLFDEVFEQPGLTGNADSRTGVNAGGFIGIRVDEMFSIQPEVLFVQKGAAFDVSRGGRTIEGHMEIDYVEIPVLAAVSFVPQGTVRPFVFGGPAVGIKTRARAEAAGREFDDFEDGIEDSEVGLVFGAGVEVSRFLVEARDSVGLSDIGVHDGDEDDLPGLKTRVFSVLAGVGF